MTRSLLITIVSALLLCAASTSFATEFTITPSFMAGGRGTGLGDFGVPESVAIDSAGRIVVTDKGNMRLHVFSIEDGRPLFDVGRYGSSPLEFNRPNGVAVDSQGRILVVEQINRRVQVLDADYRFLGTFGKVGASDGEFQKAMGIAIDSQDRIYITDESRGDVQVFDRNWNFLWKFAKRNPRLDQVESIEVHEASGRIFVCDEGKSRVNVYDLEGRYLHSFGNQGSGPGEFGNDPNAVRLDDAGRIYINDQGNTRINVYKPNTEFLASFYNSAGGMESADGLALSQKYNLFLVADQGNDRVLAFDLGAMQCQLAWVELAAPAKAMRDLEASSDSTLSDPSRPFWFGGSIYLQAVGEGSSSRKDAGIARLYSSRDRNGICVRLHETALNSGRFKASVRLGEQSDESTQQLAVFPEDVVFAHLPGEEPRAVAQLIVVPDLEVRNPSIENEPSPLLLTTDTPALAWSFHDPAGLRAQGGYELRIRRADGSLLWESGARSGPEQTVIYTGPELPPAERLQFEVRVESEGTRSPWASTSFSRNAAPRVPVRVRPAANSILRQWPTPFEADIIADPEGARQKVCLEVQWADSTVASPLWDGVVGQLRWLPVNLEVAENSRLRWRLTVDDGSERVVGPWWTIHLNRFEEPPAPPVVLGPANGDWAHGESIAFRWKPGIDPDPMQQQEFFFEWSTSGDSKTWQSRAASNTASHVWEDPIPEGTVFWRIRSRDPSGLESVSELRQLQVQRRWRIHLQARSNRGVSEELVLGAHPGARDGYQRGEDLLAALPSQAPQVLAHHQGSQMRRLITDFRCPKDVGDSPIVAVHHLIVRAAQSESATLVPVKMHLPPHWDVLLQDSNGLRLGILEEGGDPIRLWLDANGESQLRLLLQRSSQQSVFLGNETRPKLPSSDQRQTTQPHTALHNLLPRLPNPVTPGVHLLRGPVGTLDVVISLHDVRGRHLRTWAGHHSRSLIWDGLDSAGVRLAPGMYLLRYRAATSTASRKILWTGN